MNTNLIKVCKNGLYGLIDTDGNWVVMPEFEMIEDMFDDKGYCPASIKNNDSYFYAVKCGFIGRNGQWLIETIYDDVEEFNKSGLARCKLDRHFGYINRSGK